MHVHRVWCTCFLQFRRYHYSQKTAKLSFRTMGYSPWSSKNLIKRNWIKKFMQVGIDVTCMYTKSGGCGIFGFGDTTTLKNGQISFSDHGYSPWSSKNLINRNWIKKFMQVGIDVTCMYTEFGARAFSSFGDTTTLKKRPNFPFGPWAIVHGHQKI